MVRDENWYDAVGKNDWRQEQIEKREREGQEVFRLTGEDRAHRRGVVVKQKVHKCDVCNKDKHCLEVNTSDEEYDSFFCCAKCFTNLLLKGTGI